MDIAIPCNNNSITSVGLIWWLLAREVLRLRGTLARNTKWEIMPDLYFYRDLEAEAKQAHAITQGEEGETAAPVDETWAAQTTAPAAEDWSAAAPTDWAGTSWN